MIAIIAAVGKQRVIGINNRLPWSLPVDMKHFQAMTLGHTVVMGRKTMESIGKPLPNRINLVLSRNLSQPPEGFKLIQSVDQVLNLADNDTVFIIGGESIYRLFLPFAKVIYLTFIDAFFHGDSFFPELPSEEWQIVSEQPGEVDEENSYPFVFRVYHHI